MSNIEKILERCKIKFVGKVDTFFGKGVDGFRWILSIDDASFEYFTGVGHFTPFYKSKTAFIRNERPARKIIISDEGWIHLPEKLDILECLAGDARCGSELFQDFCGDLGYSEDSIKSLKIYGACQDTAIRLRKLGILNMLLDTDFCELT